MIASRKIRVLIIDDSAVVRRMASDVLNADPEIEVVGTAIDPYAARDQIKALNPDVITLDLEMPRMDGLTFLEILMQRRPTPVIVMSSLSQRGSHHALEALRLGACDVVGKPGGAFSFSDIGPELIIKIKAASGIRFRAFPPRDAAHHAARASRNIVAPASIGITDPRATILLGASTGGTEALRQVLTHLPPNLPGIAIVQHIPALFSRAFAERLAKLSSLDVREAVDGDHLSPGVALVAPGDFHLILQWEYDHHRVRVVPGPHVWHQRPAIDILFKSAADCGAAPYTVAGVLTGMGRDGADSLLHLRNKGAMTFAQNEATSVVYGMPRAAWENGAAQRQLPLQLVADFIVRQFTSNPVKHSLTAHSP